MEHTTDVLEGRFDLPGGSAIKSDGTYYWRRDTADYVEHYRVALPAEFMAHMAANDWTPPTYSRDELLVVYLGYEPTQHFSHHVRPLVREAQDDDAGVRIGG